MKEIKFNVSDSGMSEKGPHLQRLLWGSYHQNTEQVSSKNKHTILSPTSEGQVLYCLLLR